MTSPSARPLPVARPIIAERLSRFATTVFTEFSVLATSCNAVNLGQGFPDFDGPEAVKDAAVTAITHGPNQYPPLAGRIELREAIAAHAHRFYGTRSDPATEITVTTGATEAILSTVLGIVNPGDEVVLFEPFYDSYLANVSMAGGVPRVVALRPPDAGHDTWWFDRAELRAAFSPKTRLVCLNTPHNPTGKVFTKDELEFIGSLCEEHDALVLADEVYEHLVFEPAKHVRVATIASLAPRTITISSGGKSFSLTGWKIGWAIAPPALTEAVRRCHQYVTFANAAPLQLGFAEALTLPDSYFTKFTAFYRRKRDFLAEALTRAGLETLTPEGTYFLLAEVPGRHASDDAFCRWLTEKVGVAAIPVSALCTGAELSGRRFARFAFCKTDAVLEEAAKRLQSGLTR